MKEKSLCVGSMGESIAAKYLHRKGYHIIENNYRTRYAEIDLIARKNNLLVFIEVKTRVGERYGSPEEAISHNKLYRLVKNAQAYIVRRSCMKEYRIDAVCIVLDESNCLKRISHHENITL